MKINPVVNPFINFRPNIIQLKDIYLKDFRSYVEIDEDCDYHFSAIFQLN